MGGDGEYFLKRINVSFSFWIEKINKSHIDKTAGREGRTNPRKCRLLSGKNTKGELILFFFIQETY